MTSRNVPQHCQTTLFGIVLLLVPGTMWRLPVKLTHRMTRDLGGLGLDVFELKAAGRHFRDIGEFKKGGFVPIAVIGKFHDVSDLGGAGGERPGEAFVVGGKRGVDFTTVVVGADFVIA